MGVWSEIVAWANANEGLVAMLLGIAGLAGFFFRQRETARTLRYAAVPRPARLIVRPVAADAVGPVSLHLAQQGGRVSEESGSHREAVFSDAEYAVRAAFSIRAELDDEFGPFELLVFEPDGAVPARVGTDHIWLTGPIRRALADVPDLSIDAVGGDAALPFVVKRGAPPRGAARRYLLPAASLALCVSALVVLVGGESGDGDQEIRSIVVLPLEYTEGDSTQEEWAEGITDSLIGELGRLGEFRVISRTTAEKVRNKTLPEIADLLEIEAAVEGSVRVADNTIRIRTRLVRARSEEQLWSGRYDRELRKVLQLEREIVRTVAQEIRGGLTEAGLAGLGEQREIDPEAYRAFLRGRTGWLARTAEALELAELEFRHAISLEPEWADPHALLGLVYVVFPGYNVEKSASAWARARASIDRAIELDPDHSLARAALGHLQFLQWDWEESRATLKRAIELNPNNATAFQWYAYCFTAVGDHEQAIDMARRAVEVDPLSTVARLDLGQALRSAGKTEEALELISTTVAEDSQYELGHIYLASLLLQTGAFERSLDAIERGERVERGLNGYLQALRVRNLAALGRRANADAALETLLDLAANTYFEPVSLAAALYDASREEDAFAALQRGVDEKSTQVPFIANPTFSALVRDPRALPILQPVGLPLHEPPSNDP